MSFLGEESWALSGLGLSVQTDPLPFLFHSLLKKHGHQFCWSTTLMVEVLRKIGFKEVNVASPGVSAYDPSTAIERRVRGVHAEHLKRDLGVELYDPESGIVEARK